MAKVHQEVTFSAPPARFATSHELRVSFQFTGAPAEIGAKAGDAWSAYGGQISGYNIEVVDGVRVVQTWRAGNWPEGVHSLVRFEFKPDGNGTKLVLDHDALSEKRSAPHRRWLGTDVLEPPAQVSRRLRPGGARPRPRRRRTKRTRPLDEALARHSGASLLARRPAYWPLVAQSLALSVAAARSLAACSRAGARPRHDRRGGARQVWLLREEPPAPWSSRPAWAR